MTMKFITRESEKTIAYATQNVKKKINTQKRIYKSSKYHLGENNPTTIPRIS